MWYVEHEPKVDDYRDVLAYVIELTCEYLNLGFINSTVEGLIPHTILWAAVMIVLSSTIVPAQFLQKIHLTGETTHWIHEQYALLQWGELRNNSVKVNFYRKKYQLKLASLSHTASRDFEKCLNKKYDFMCSAVNQIARLLGKQFFHFKCKVR